MLKLLSPGTAGVSHEVNSGGGSRRCRDGSSGEEMKRQLSFIAISVSCRELI